MLNFSNLNKGIIKTLASPATEPRSQRFESVTLPTELLEHDLCSDELCVYSTVYSYVKMIDINIYQSE